MKKKGVSPIIATVLLIFIVIVIALIIFFWLRGFIKEPVTKFDKNIQLSCNDVQFDSAYSGGTLQISNTGNVPIFQVRVKIIKSDKSYNKESLLDWPNLGLLQGDSFNEVLNLQSNVNKIVVIPVLIGSSKKGKRTFTCGGRYGKEIQIK